MERLLLTEYLSDGISKRAMYQVILQFVDALIETEGTDRQVVLQLDGLEICKGKVDLQYETGFKPVSISRIIDFIKEVIFRCIFAVGEEIDDLAEFLRFLDNEREVTLAYIYEYIMDELDLDIPPNRQNLFASDCPPIEETTNGETGVLDVSFWEHNKALKEADKIQKHSQQLLENMQPGRTGTGEETGLLDDSFWERKMQSMNGREPGGAKIPSARKVSLVNTKSGEEISITRSPFVVGKDSSNCDLVIQNKTISRKHAEIIIKGSHYYVKDLGSTNKTFLGSTEIAANVEVEIFPGTRVKFSNEIFELVIR